MTAKAVRAAVAACGHVPYPGSSLRPGVPYQPVPFLEFTDLTSQRPMAWMEWVIVMREFWDRRRGFPWRVLDIGANIGMHAVLWHEMGADVVAVEPDPSNRGVLEALKIWGHLRRLEIHETYTPPSHEGPLFDLTICLNVHQWMRQAWGVEKTHQYLRALCANTQVIVFQTAHAGGYGEVRVPELQTKEDCVKYLKSCGKRTVEVIGISGYRKPRYLLWGE